MAKESLGRIAGIIYDDIAAGKGLCTTVFVQGCPHRCKGCHNPDSWDFNGGEEFTKRELLEIDISLNKNNIIHNLALMGGEPLCPENVALSRLLIEHCKHVSPKSIIYVWSGYTLEQLKERKDSNVDWILDNIHFLIDGLYDESLKDLSLEMRGSSNQIIHNLTK